jgi:hemolysin activation/secretion protein
VRLSSGRGQGDWVNVMFSKGTFRSLARLAGIAALTVVLATPVMAPAATQPPGAGAMSVPAFGSNNDVTRIAPRLPAPEAAPVPTSSLPTAPIAATPVDNRPAIAVPILQGLVFVPKDGLKPDGVSIESAGAWRVVQHGVPLLDGPEFQALLHPYIGKVFTLADITKLRQQVIKYLAEHDHPFVNATVPPQNVDSGVVQVVVTEYRLGKIDVVGAKYFSKDTIRRMSNLKPGQVITSSQVTENANLLNSNPFMTPDVNFKEGAVPGTTDMEVKVTDRRPLRVYAGFDNQGVRSLGLEEYLAGINWGNAFGTGMVASYQFTHSVSGRFTSHSFDDVIPVSSVDSVQVFGSYGTLRPLIAEGFDNQGHNAMASVRYVRTLPIWGHGLSNVHLRIGYDFKFTDNNLEFVTIPLIAAAAEVHQFPVILDGVQTDRFGQTAVENDLIYAPGRMTARNTDAAFQSLVVGASASYVYDKLSITRTTRLPKNVTWIVRGIFQQSNQILPYTEQLGGGGVGSVRGYYPDTGLGSSGELISTELRLPAFSPSAIFGKPKFPDLAQVGVFYDYGSLRQPKTFLGSQAPLDLAGTGFFVHYSVDRYIDIDFNMGWQLKQVATEPPGLGHYAAVAVVISN